VQTSLLSSFLYRCVSLSSPPLQVCVSYTKKKRDRERKRERGEEHTDRERERRGEKEESDL